MMISDKERCIPFAFQLKKKISLKSFFLKRVDISARNFRGYIDLKLVLTYNDFGIELRTRSFARLYEIQEVIRWIRIRRRASEEIQ